MTDALAVTGWELDDFAGEARLWVRDRAAAERRALEHDGAGRRPHVKFTGVGATKPFRRPRGRTESIPAGWIAEPVLGPRGTDDPSDIEVVYNPRRHDVMRVPESRSDAVLALLADQGWAPAAGGPGGLLWRDRLAGTRSVPEQPAHPATDIRGPAL